jgi:hypothetical protein
MASVITRKRKRQPNTNATREHQHRELQAGLEGTLMDTTPFPTVIVAIVLAYFWSPICSVCFHQERQAKVCANLDCRKKGERTCGQGRCGRTCTCGCDAVVHFDDDCYWEGHAFFICNSFQPHEAAVTHEAIDEVCALIPPSSHQNKLITQLQKEAFQILNRERSGKRLLLPSAQKKLKNKQLKELVIQELTLLVKLVN